MTLLRSRAFGATFGFSSLYLAASLVVFCAEATVVRTEKLWPRSLLTPFTDNVQLTGGDRRAYTSYATAQRAKGFQHINTDFHPPDPDSRPTGGRGR